jgi:hypothetical protein
LLFYPEDKDSNFFQNTGTYLPMSSEFHPIRL